MTLVFRSNGKSLDEFIVSDNSNKLWNSWEPEPSETDKEEMIQFVRRLLEERNDSLVIYLWSIYRRKCIK